VQPDSYIEPARVPAPHRVRNWSLRLAIAAVALIAVAVLTVPTMHGTAAPLPLAVAADGAARLVSSRSGSAIFGDARMLPGQSVTGTVTIANQGTAPGRIELTTSALLDAPGPGGGRLGDRLRVVVRDETAGTIRYQGSLADLAQVDLGTFGPHESHRFRLTVDFPAEAGDNAYQSSSLSVSFDWQAETAT
jgi:hypothetical protein